jgi:hypothetical protein
VAAAVVAVIAIIAAVVAASPASPPAAKLRGVTLSGTGPVAKANAAPAIVGGGRGPRRAVTSAGPGAVPLVLTAADHRNCPAAAVACVDLTRHITWLQASGKTVFGPVQMEPGKPGSAHQTPRGTFQVAWKAGPSLMSNIYHEPMPWATFFAAGGIAFHGGSLTAWSHGCVHLTVANAYYYHQHLPIGAEVVVF